MVKLKILYFVNDLKKTERIENLLKSEKIEYSVESVNDRFEYVNMLMKNQFNILLIDFSLIQMDGITAIQIANDICHELPVIVISGNIGEEKAVETLKNGAVDYILEDNLSRLIPVLEQTLERTELKKERKMAEVSLIQERNNLLNVLMSMTDGVCIVNQHNFLTFVNPALEKEFGPWQGRKCFEYFHGSNNQCPWCKREEVVSNKNLCWECQLKKNKKYYDMMATTLNNPDGTTSQLEIFHDVTERKNSEIKLRHINTILNIYLEINQLIVREKNPDLLIKKVCKALTAINKYTTAWIILMDESGNGYKITESAKGYKKTFVRESIDQSNIMSCCKASLYKKIVMIDTVEHNKCMSCSFNQSDSPKKKMVTQLKYEDKSYGFIGISTTQDYKISKEESTLFLDVAGNLSFALNSLRIDKQRLRALEMIKENIHFLQVLIDALPIPIYYKDDKGRYLGCNDAYAEFFEFDKHRIKGKTIFSVLPQEEAQQIYEKDQELFKKSGIQQDKREIRTRDGQVKSIIVNKALFTDKYGNTGGLIGVVFDITELKDKETALKDSEEFSNQIIESSNDCISVLDLKGNLLFMNTGGIELMEIGDITPYLFKPWFELWRGNAKKSIRKAIAKVLQGEVCSIQCSSRTVKHTHRHWNVMISPIFSGNKKIERLLAVSHDITDQKSTEKKLRLSLKEKETLLKELHHRVKNNLMIIISLLQLTSKEIKNQNIVSMLTELQNRVHSLALVHDKLYKSGNLNKIKFSSYIKDIVRYLSSVFTFEFNPVNLKMDLEERFMDINYAIPCGLIINELVTNSLKHAFTTPSGLPFTSNNETKKNEILIRFFRDRKKSHKKKQQTFTIIISDNGKGISEITVKEPSDSFGLKLVNILVKQLNGTLSVENTGGTAYTIRFSES